MTQVTETLNAIQRGEQQAAAELLPLIYGELRKLAAAKLAQESLPQTLNATALVHEAYVRLVGGQDQKKWDGRGHFFAAAAEAMRRILVDSARRKRSQQKSGYSVRLDQAPELCVPLRRSPEEVLSVSDALDQLAQVDAKCAELVKLRYFAGFTIPEAAELISIAPRTADSLWAYARAWLAVRLRSD